jgi:hypothetical protein
LNRRLSDSFAIDRVTRYGLCAAIAVSTTALAFVMAFVVLTFRPRILDGVEGALLFDAARLRQRLPLWVAPAQGAWDYGPVPARYYVAYTGVWAYVLSFFPAAWGELPARAIASLSWFGLLVGIVVTSPPERRKAALVAAVFVGGVYTSALFGSAGRPDSPALLLSGVALTRSIRRDRTGFFDGALFALAAFIKPNVLGLSSGAFAGELWLRRSRAWPAIAGGGACACRSGSIRPRPDFSSSVCPSHWPLIAAGVRALSAACHAHYGHWPAAASGRS